VTKEANHRCIVGDAPAVLDHHRGPLLGRFEEFRSSVVSRNFGTPLLASIKILIGSRTDSASRYFLLDG
jgi:hypothetical protein